MTETFEEIVRDNSFAENKAFCLSYIVLCLEVEMTVLRTQNLYINIWYKREIDELKRKGKHNVDTLLERIEKRGTNMTLSEKNKITGILIIDEEKGTYTLEYYRYKNVQYMFPHRRTLPDCTGRKLGLYINHQRTLHPFASKTRTLFLNDKANSKYLLRKELGTLHRDDVKDRFGVEGFCLRNLRHFYTSFYMSLADENEKEKIAAQGFHSLSTAKSVYNHPDTNEEFSRVREILDTFEAQSDFADYPIDKEHDPNNQYEALMVKKCRYIFITYLSSDQIKKYLKERDERKKRHRCYKNFIEEELYDNLIFMIKMHEADYVIKMN